MEQTLTEGLAPGFRLRSAVLPGIVAAGVLAIAFIGGLIIGPGANSAVGSILNLSASSSGAVSDVGNSLPLVGFAFAAGMVATVNPCGFVMLPAYLTMWVSDADPGGTATVSRSSLVPQLAKAIYVSAALGLGFVILFGVVGFSISAGARSLGTVFPWLGFGLGFVMAGLGAYLFAGGKLYTSSAQSAASRIGNPADKSLRGYFLFGISYALASLSCTLPIFLGIISSSLATGGIASATSQFLAYALGMTFVITLLTIAIAIFKGAMVNQLRRVMPYVNPISAGILIVVGGYLIFYWLTEGDLARSFGVG